MVDNISNICISEKVRKDIETRYTLINEPKSVKYFGYNRRSKHTSDQKLTKKLYCSDTTHNGHRNFRFLDKVNQSKTTI